MENSKEPAFPRPYSEMSKHDGRGAFSQQDGLTKREYFAGLAMQGILSGRDMLTPKKDLYSSAIEIADELLKQLEIK